MTVCRLQSLVFLWFPTHNFSMYNEQVITVLLLYHFSGKGKGLLEANPQVGMASISEGSKDKSQHNPSRFVLIHIAFYSTCLDDKKKQTKKTKQSHFLQEQKQNSKAKRWLTNAKRCSHVHGDNPNPSEHFTIRTTIVTMLKLFKVLYLQNK